MALIDKRRVVVFGIDGLGVNVLQKIIKRFPEFKNLKRISEECLSVRSELPELSSVNWTSFYTAKGPEDHGIFGFVHIDPKSYNSYLVNFSHVAQPTIFDKLGDRGLISKVINLPNTYPARPINGVLISGFVAESFEKSVYPRFLIPILKSHNYILEPDATKAVSKKEEFLKDLLDSLESRKRIFDLFWRDLAWNLFVFVITEFDRMAHFFIKDMLNPSSALHESCKIVLQKIDLFVGDLFERFYALPEPKRLIIMSDHGFDLLDVEFDLNVWLKKMGLLCFSYTPKHELDSSAIDEKTYAFALDPGRIYVHKKGRFSKGRVDKFSYPSLIKDIKHSLQSLTYQGKRIIKKVLTKEEIYPGCDCENVPDLLCVPEKGIDLKAKFNRTEQFGYFGRDGTHTFFDSLFWDSLKGSPKRIREIGSLVLNFFKGSIYV